MTTTEARLADALDAAARALREDTLRPLLVPDRPRRRPTLASPLAAAAALLLVVGIGVALARYLPGSGQPTMTGPPGYYVEAGLSGLPTVRSTATGKVTDTVKVPYVSTGGLAANLVAAAGNGVFFAVVTEPRWDQIYRFRLSAAGQVQGLAQVPGRVPVADQFAVSSMAASPDGSRVAVALASSSQSASANSSCSSSGGCSQSPTTTTTPDDYIQVVSTATGAMSTWQGGTGNNFAFTVLNLSWTRDGSELDYFGQWCPRASASCARGAGTGGARTELRALNPASGGGSLTGGRLVRQLSPTFPDVAQAVISPDSSTITAVALTGPVTGSPTASGTPSELTVEQISATTGKRLRVLYRRDLSSTSGVNGGPVAVTLSPDSSGRQWLLDGFFCATGCTDGFNGWISGGWLVPLPPGDGTAISEAW